MSQIKHNIVNAGNFQGVLAPELKAEALQVLATIDFPTTKTEAWKYTRLGKISNKEFTIQQDVIASIEKYKINEKAYRIVFVNGFYKADLSSFGSEVSIQPLSESSAIQTQAVNVENEIFNSLNTVFATDGVQINIQAKLIVETPIEIINVVTGERTIASTRNIIKAEKFSQASIVQSYFSANANETLTNVITEVFVEENANLTIDKIQLENETAYQIATEQVDQAKNSTFTINTITLNGGLVRNNLNIDINGENCETNLNGVYVLKGQQHVDNHTVVDHKVPHCNSNESYKGVMYDKSTAVFNGKVFVRKDAQKTNAFQQNANVLMSLDATVNSKPELEIYADDVKCSHGSTTGQLNEEAIFYLRARGISEKSARQLVVGAFIADTIEKIENESVKNFVNDYLGNNTPF